jgi:hypothetical protein
LGYRTISLVILKTWAMPVATAMVAVVAAGDGAMVVAVVAVVAAGANLLIFPYRNHLSLLLLAHPYRNHLSLLLLAHPYRNHLSLLPLAMRFRGHKLVKVKELLRYQRPLNWYQNKNRMATARVAGVAQHPMYGYPRAAAQG